MRKGDDEGRTKLIPKEARNNRPEKMRVFEEDECKEIEQYVARKQWYLRTERRNGTKINDIHE